MALTFAQRKALGTDHIAYLKSLTPEERWAVRDKTLAEFPELEEAYEATGLDFGDSRAKKTNS